MSAVYPTSPTDVPATLTQPTSNYRRHAWLAVAGLALFVVTYFALAGWFAWTAWRLFSGYANAGSENVLANLFAGTCAGFLAIFMFKALFFMKHSEASEDLEVTAAEQPELFEFLHRLAAETGAPRPHRVYLSGRVNAAVFYDLSIANLLVPSRKNLEIGLGLVNVLTLGELKAVLAHEFGHFAQKSMAVGRWVYIAQQIAGHIVARRDALDSFLVKLSRFDLRIAWIGWLLQLIVWSIRSLVDLLFRGVVLAQRALSREMEFQADLVAVSVTGSDALIHALHRLGAADAAWDQTLSFASGELQEGRPVKDLFAVQLGIIEKVRSLLSDPAYGVAPPLPSSQPETHRIFKVALAAPPRMWSTHPSNADREANAKRVYVRADIDDRSAWTLFKDAQALRERMSAHLAPKHEHTPVEIDVSLKKLNEEYARGFFNAQYRGAYLGRSIVRHARQVDELYGPRPKIERLADELDALYPQSLSAEIERLRNLEEERQMLIALREGFLTAPGGVIRHRGVAMSRKNLPAAIEAVEREVNACAEIVREHDRRCRAAHHACAKALGETWAKYLRGLLELLHYADHVEANLLDAHGVLSHTVAIATADGKVSSKELNSIVHAADMAYAALKDVHDAVDQVVPDRTVLNRMKVESWPAALEKLALPPPSNANIGDWLNAVGGWVRSASASLASLRLAALEQLLAAETQVAVFTRKGMQPPAGPPASSVPREYRLLTPGSERPREARLTWWDRFQTASGVFPTVARFATAAVIIGAVLLVASGVGTSTVHVFNGLERTVVTRINETEVTVSPGQHRAVDVAQTDRLHITTTTADGRPIEEFDTGVEGGFAAKNVYNIAGAGALVSWVAVYGPGTPPPPQMMGAPRWTTTHADVLFAEPPESVKTRGGTAERKVITGVGIEVPERVLNAISDEAARNAVIAAHARWDESNSDNVYQWISYASTLPSFEQILRERLQAEPNEPLNLRFEQDSTTGAAHDAVCEKHKKMAAAAPNDPNLQYVSVRCAEDSEEQDRALLSLHERWPDNGWLAQAAASIQAGQGNFAKALEGLEYAAQKLPPMRAHLAVEATRLKRVLAGDAKADLGRLPASSEYVRMLLGPETDEGTKETSWAAYAYLAQGDLQKALAAEKMEQNDRARVVRLVAASDGASREMIESALALPLDAGLDADTYLPTLSLAARTGRDTSALLPLASKVFPRDAQRLLDAFTAIRNRASRTEIEAALRGLDARGRGYVYVAAAILGGADCPREWRAAARQLLFASERPYLL